jgi:hypothetical protein
MTKLKEYLLKEQTDQELGTSINHLTKIILNIELAVTGIKNLRKTTKAVAGRELKQLEDALKHVYGQGGKALNKLKEYKGKM